MGESKREKAYGIHAIWSWTPQLCGSVLSKCGDIHYLGLSSLYLMRADGFFLNIEASTGETRCEEDLICGHAGSSIFCLVTGHLRLCVH